jgi:hypothetical protein
LQFFTKKYFKIFFIKAPDPYPDSLKMLDPYPDPDSMNPDPQLLMNNDIIWMEKCVRMFDRTIG